MPFQSDIVDYLQDILKPEGFTDHERKELEAVIHEMTNQGLKEESTVAIIETIFELAKNAISKEDI